MVLHSGFPSQYMFEYKQAKEELGSQGVACVAWATHIIAPFSKQI